jgi:hypothetical protein
MAFANRNRIGQMPLTAAAISRDWKTSRSWVSQCIKKGCPVSDLESARLWRKRYASSRATTNSKQLAQLAVENEGSSPKTNRLIAVATAKALAFRGYDLILDLIEGLPQRVALRCNPGDPQRALTILESECTGITCDAYEAYAAWSKVDPPTFGSAA